jgi:hypothetical protein
MAFPIRKARKQFRTPLLHTGEAPAPPVSGGLAPRRLASCPQPAPFPGRARRGEVLHTGLVPPLVGFAPARSDARDWAFPPAPGMARRGRLWHTGEEPAPPVPGGLPSKRRAAPEPSALYAYRPSPRRKGWPLAGGSCAFTPDPFALSVADDLLLFDRVYPVMYQRRDLSGLVVETVECVQALFREEAVTLAGIGRQGKHSDRKARIHFRASEVTFTPRKGDRLVSDQLGTWEVVEEVKVSTLSTRYAVTCLRVG